MLQPFTVEKQCLAGLVLVFLFGLASTTQASKKEVQISTQNVDNTHVWASYEVAHDSLLHTVRGRLQEDCEQLSGSALSYVDVKSVKMQVFERGHTSDGRKRTDSEYFLSASHATGICRFSEQAGGDQDRDSPESLDNAHEEMLLALESELTIANSGTSDFSRRYDRNEYEFIPIFANETQQVDTRARTDSSTYQRGMASDIVDKIEDQLRDLCRQKLANYHDWFSLGKIEISGIDYQRPPNAENRIHLVKPKPYVLSIKSATTQCIVRREDIEQKQDEEPEQVAEEAREDDENSFWTGEATSNQTTNANSSAKADFWSGEKATTKAVASKSNVETGFWSGERTNKDSLTGKSGQNYKKERGNDDFWSGDKGDASAFEIVNGPNSTQGVQDSNGKMLIPFGEWRVLSYEHGLAKVQVEVSSREIRERDCGIPDLYEVTFDEGYIGSDGKWLVSPDRRTVEAEGIMDICLRAVYD